MWALPPSQVLHSARVGVVHWSPPSLVLRLHIDSSADLSKSVLQVTV